MIETTPHPRTMPASSPRDLDVPSSVPDERTFAELADRHRRELRVHCYRLLGSFHDAEDMVQETYLRAWKHRGGFEGRSSFRAWLYRIATNACLDFLRRPSRRHVPLSAGGEDLWHPGEVPWLEPFPDALLPEEGGPEQTVVDRETIELTFIVAIQHLPPRQRAVLVLRDVLGWPAAEVAGLLETSTAAVNSALQRARVTMRTHLPARRSEWASAAPTEEERSLLAGFMRASEEGDMAAMAALLRDDFVFTMPPEPERYEGRDLVIEQWTPFMTGPTRMGDWRMLPTWANHQPAAANYVRKQGERVFEGLSLDVLRVEGGLIAEITTFPAAVFPHFGLPPRL